MVLQSASYPKSDGRCVRFPAKLKSDVCTNVVFLNRSDAHDFVLYSVVPHLTYATPYTYPLLVCTAISLLLLLPILPYIPLRQAMLVLGLAPFAFTHPLTQGILPQLITPYLKHAHVRIARLVDDDRLEDRHWRSGSSLREVELWENERFVPSATGGSWSKSALKPDERKGWTRGRDGWSDDTPGGGGDVRSVVQIASLIRNSLTGK